jgi:spermidine/putrescine transport system substrate-binding protein
MSEEGSTRREYVGTAATIGVTALAGGCLGGRRTQTSTRARTRTSNQRLREELGVEMPEYDYGDELRVYQWVNYWPQRVVRNFERAFGVSVSVDTYPSNEKLYRTLKERGSDAYDLVFPSDYMVSILADEGLIRPIDRELIPNWSNLEPRWVRNAPYDPGDQRYSVPFQWGTTGIGWHESVAGGPLESWDAMWDTQYAGQVTWLDDIRETVGASLKRLGYSLNTRDEDKIMEAKEALLNQRSLVDEYDSRYTEDFLINREASPVHTWSGEAFIAYWELYDGEVSPVNYRIPEEGGPVWVDTAAVTAGATNPNAAHAFVNYVLAPLPGGAVSDYTRYGTPNAAAKEYVDEEMLNNPGVYPPDGILDDLEFIRDVGPAIEHYERAWEDITGE